MRRWIPAILAAAAAIASWFGKELLKAAMFDQVLRMAHLSTLPLLDWAAEYGPPAAFAALTIFLLWRPWAKAASTAAPRVVRVAKQEPLPPAASPNERFGVDFVPVGRAAADIYGRLGPCALRDGLDAVGRTETGKIRAVAALILYQSPELWGIKSPSSRYERIEVVERVNRALQMHGGELILGEPGTPRGYYRDLMMRQADVAATFEKIKDGGLSQVPDLERGDFEDR
jgi:hypothetical protein